MVMVRASPSSTLPERFKAALGSDDGGNFWWLKNVRSAAQGSAKMCAGGLDDTISMLEAFIERPLEALLRFEVRLWMSEAEELRWALGYTLLERWFELREERPEPEPDLR
jgi:hypothetical protein